VQFFIARFSASHSRHKSHLMFKNCHQHLIHGDNVFMSTSERPSKEVCINSKYDGNGEILSINRAEPTFQGFVTIEFCRLSLSTFRSTFQHLLQHVSVRGARYAICERYNDHRGMGKRKHEIKAEHDCESHQAMITMTTNIQIEPALSQAQILSLFPILLRCSVGRAEKRTRK
jgi:hypothetical protein